MPDIKITRKHAFHGALLLAGVTIDEWAAPHGLTRGLVHREIARRKGGQTIADIDAFIANAATVQDCYIPLPRQEALALVAMALTRSTTTTNREEN